MSTEYRRGIPSTAHVEAATRLGLLFDDNAPFATQARRQFSADDAGLSFRPIRPDGTPVDWEVLDQEVARVEQQGQPATVTPIAPAAPLTPPQGFRADLWQRICSWITSTYLPNIASIAYINDFGIVGQTRGYSWDTLGLDTQTDEADRRALIARWTVYQELKPLYDLVDGAQGEAAMPRDVEVAWYSASVNERRRAVGSWILARDVSGLLIKNNRNTVNWRKDEPNLGAPLRNFAAVLDAVAERRVAERMLGQTQAPTVTSAQPEPRRFADVRPDRHGWRWWRLFGSDCGALGTLIEVSPVHGWRVKDDPDADWHLRGHYNSAVDGIRTVIPTDEQGNPVSWEAAGFAAEAMRSAQETVQRAANDATPARSVGDIEWTAAGLPVTRDMTVDPVTGVVRSTHAARIESPTEAITTLPLPLPRFTADELDDVDHSKTTKLDKVTLRRGKLPTVEQIAKYREVRARRAGGTVADALKESRIDCEVAQYVLERWVGGLGDADTVLLLRAAGCIAPLKDAPRYSIRAFDPKQSEVDRRSQDFLRTHNAALDTSEKPNPTVQRERQEAEERRQRLAELRQRLATERAAQPTEEAPTTTSRFALIEPDPQADPTASIRAWEARQAAAKVRPTAALPRIVKPAAAPRRPAIEVVDAEVDGLSRVEVVTALFGRAFNGGC